MKLISTLLLCFVVGSATIGQTYRIRGRITDTAHGPHAGVRVTLAPLAKTAVTDKNGDFVFTVVPAGLYTLSAILPHHKPFTRAVRVVDRDTNIHIILYSVYRQLQQVVVTQTPVRARKQQTALNLEVVNNAFIARNLGGSLMKTLERLPGIKTIGIGAGQSKPLIRGLGFNRVVALDKGIKHEGQQWGADHGLEIDQFAVSEVELLKGAASFIYGSDAIGGVINIKPAAPPPPNTFRGSVELVGKSNNSLYGGSINLLHRKNKWFFEERVTYQNYADFRVPADTLYIYDYAVPVKRQMLRNTAGRETGLHFHAGYLGERFRSTIYISNIFSNSGFFANAHGLEPRRVDTDVHDASARDLQMPRQQVNHLKVINRSVLERGQHRLELDLGFQRNFRQEYSAYVNHGYMPAIYPDSMPADRNLERAFDKYVYSVNARDQMTIGKHQLTAGVNAELQDNGIAGWSFLVPAFKQLTAGAFLYDKYNLGDDLILHGALRYDYGKISVSKYSDWFPSETAQGHTAYLVRADERTVHFNSLVWSLGLNYNRRQFTVKAHVGKSFRMPIAKELAANGVNYHYFSYEKGNPNLAPEKSYQADLGIGWESKKWFIQISPFYNYFPNYIYLNPTPHHDYYYGAGNQVFEYAQSRVMRYGGEVQMRYRILKSLSVEALGEYLYAKQLSGDKKGYTLPFSPPPSVLLNATWSPTINSKFTGNYLSIDYRISYRQHNIVPPEKKTPAYQVINLQAGTQAALWKHTLQISFQIQNVFNTRYLNHTSFYRLIELPEAGRNIILSVKVPFTFKPK